MKRDRYVKARAIVEAAEEDPEHFGDLPPQMDKTGNDNAVYKEMQKRLEQKEIE